jgi:outer membrane protein
VDEKPNLVYPCRMNIALALAFPIVLASFAAAAQPTPPEESNLAGAGLRLRPAYDGSSSRRADVVPLLDYDRRDLFARSTQGVLEAGAHLELGPGFKVGGQLAWEEGRKKRESELLRNRTVPDIGVGLSAGLHAQWDTKVGPAPVYVLGRLRHQIDVDKGAQADLRVTAGVYQSGPFGLAVFTQATWATRKSVRLYYGQPGFEPSGGLLFASLGLLGSYDLSRKWALLASLEGRRLQGDAARSPLTERRSSTYAVAGAAYRF